MLKGYVYHGFVYILWIKNDKATKKAWFKSAHRKICTTKTEYYFFQDHFDASIVTYTNLI